MLATTKWKQLQDLLDTVTREELIWMNGYLSGLVANEPNAAAAPAASGSTVSQKLTVVYGTETGNSKKLALQLATLAKQQRMVTKVQDASQYRITGLDAEENLVVIMSTHGEGEPPATAKKFYEALNERTALLPQLKYAVLALGDSAYPLFCKTGEDVDVQLNALKATRLLPALKCDTDFEAPATTWLQQLLQQLQNSAAPAEKPAVTTPVKTGGGKKYYNGHIISTVNLNDRGSLKATYHIEISTAETVDYKPGDALAIIPHNRPAMVQRILDLTGVDAAAEVETPKFKAPVQELLTKNLNICYLLASTIKKYAAVTQQEIPDTRMDLVDLLRIYPVQNAAQFIEVLTILTPVAPRLYTISSSPLVHGNEVHITVARKAFYAQNEERFGLCSEFLGDLPIDTPLEFYIHKNKSFKLPGADKDVIMIGPGTGVAPFRSFLAHRDAAGDTGRNWFFFGENNFTTDFLYQSEIQQYKQTGVLTQASLAFEKAFPGAATVPEKLLQQANEVYDWLNNGASVYISGDKEPMSKEVEDALLTIIAQQGGLPEAGAKDYLDNLKKEGRYEKDVY
jgi:sulfite reductase (NADPH) flavoprotein alpha-component